MTLLQRRGLWSYRLRQRFFSRNSESFHNLDKSDILDISDPIDYNKVN